MNKLEIVSGSLKISKDGVVLLLVPKDACSVNALELKSAIPKVFGYDMHTNILANPTTKELDLNHSYYQRLPLFEDVSKIPYNDLNEVFDVKKVIENLK